VNNKLAALAAAALLAGLAPMAAKADHGVPGFETGSCAYPAGAPLPGSGAVRAVPSAYPTIQAAVDAAAEGDTVLVSPGTYHESVTVHTPGLRIRGTDRNGVVLDGETTREVGIEVEADRVAVESMTVHSYKEHGVRWFEQTGYWGRYLTAYNNGLYGIFAFGSRCGQFDHDFTSGNSDSGFYIGECYPCDAVIHDVIAFQNALGYSGTNAGGNLVIRDSQWVQNAMGLVPNSLDGEERPPQRGATIKNNYVADNNTFDAPGVGIAGQFFGSGIVIAGGTSNAVYGNTVVGHQLAGIAVTPLPDQNVWIATGNTIWGNTVSHDAAAYPDAYDLAQGASSGMNNCWADNTFATSAPASIQDVWSCALPTTPPGGDPRVEAALAQGAAGLNGRTPSPWQTWPAPGPQTNQTSDLDGPLDSWLPALGI
jgi:hypothetical protein